MTLACTAEFGGTLHEQERRNGAKNRVVLFYPIPSSEDTSCPPRARRLRQPPTRTKRLKDRDVIASRRSGGHTPGICKAGDRTTGALAQTGQGNQSALYSRYHRKGTYALLWSQDRRAHASNMLPKPTRLQSPDCVFKVPRVNPSKQLPVILWPRWTTEERTLRRFSGTGISVVRLAGFLVHCDLSASQTTRSRLSGIVLGT